MIKNDYSHLLKSKKILSFLIVAFTSAFSDNMLRTILIFWGSTSICKNTSIDSTWALVVSIVFLIPFLSFSGYGGYFANKYPKHRVIIITRFFELINLVFLAISLYFNNVYCGLFALAITALISSILGPAKYSFIPELVKKQDVSNLNALVEFSTTIGIAGGVTLGGWLYHWYFNNLYDSFKLFFLVISIGFLASFFLPQTKAQAPDYKFNTNPLYEIVGGFKYLTKRYYLLLCLIGHSFFWFSGALMGIILPKYGMELLNLHQGQTSFITMYLSMGLLVGVLFAGRWSNNKIETGIIPFGLFWVTLSSLILSIFHVYIIVVLAVFAFGFGSGMYIVPINAILQTRSSPNERAKVIASNNFFGLLSICGAFLFFFFLDSGFLMNISIDRVFFVMSVINLGCFVFIIRTIPYIGVRSVLWFLSRLIIKTNVWNNEKIPEKGPILIASNHISYLDGIIIGSVLNRNLRYLAWDKIFKKPIVGKMLKILRAIPVSNSGITAIKESLNKSNIALQRGEAVFICPEGEISRTGHIMQFRKGIERIIEGKDIPIIPVYISYPEKSSMKNKKGKFSFWRFLLKMPIEFNVVIGEAINSSKINNANQIKKEIKTLEASSFKLKRKNNETLPYLFIKQMKKNLFRKNILVDNITSKGMHLNGLKSLTGALVFSRQIQRICKNESHVGIIMPPSVYGSLLNIGVNISGFVPVNLNFTSGNESIQSALDQCEIKTIFTSKKIWNKLGIKVNIEKIVFLENFRKEITSFTRIKCMLHALLMSSKKIMNKYNYYSINKDSTATILFSSGTTGVPKGIVLSHHNIISNIEQIRQVLPHNKKYIFMSALPYFHSFGFNAGMWLPIVIGCRVVYHPIILDVKIICQLISKYKADVMFSVPNFYNMALKLANKDQLTSLKFVVSGAAKLDTKTYDLFKKKFDLSIFEGYGCTEMSPVVSTNVPNFKNKYVSQDGNKFHSMGRILPGILYRIVDFETFKDCPEGKEGLLLLKGENTMQGYFGKSREETFIDGDWYNTGDIVKIEKGFLYLTDRLARFSKIGGEMVPHLKIEGEIINLLNESKNAIVVFIVDEKGNEKIAVLYNDLNTSSSDLHKKLLEGNLPRLWIPKEKFLIQEKELPMLGSGKPNLHQARLNVLKKLGLE